MLRRAEKKLMRRHFLRGAGSIAIGLPFLLGREGSSSAQVSDGVPERLLTAYFGNGFPANLSADGYTGVLAPIASFAPKLTMVRGIETHATAPGPGHDAGSHAFCCAIDSGGDNTNKQGPSLDWVAHEGLSPQTPFQTVNAGVFSGKQGGKRVRWIHSWRGARQPNEPFSNPLKMFEALFGGGNVNSPDEVDVQAALRRHQERTSVLDAVRAEYQALIGPASGYPASSRAIITDHLELLRDVEKRVLALNAEGAAEACQLPTGAEDIEATQGNLGGYMDHWDQIWPVMTDIYVAALRCDLFRFGNVLVTNGGDEFSHRVDDDFAQDIHGDWFHAYGQHEEGVEEVIEWEWRLLADFLSKLDDAAFPDANGNTILENATVLLGSELGSLPHGHDDLTFLLAGAKGRFAGGVHELSGRSDVDLYQTVLRSLGVNTPFGDQEYADDLLPILV